MNQEAFKKFTDKAALNTEEEFFFNLSLPDGTTQTAQGKLRSSGDLTKFAVLFYDQEAKTERSTLHLIRDVKAVKSFDGKQTFI